MSTDAIATSALADWWASAQPLAKCEDMERAFLEGSTRRTGELKAEFHRARGEHRLATMAFERADAHLSFVTDGSIMLMEGKDGPNTPASFEPDPRLAALVAERLMGLAATEEVRDVYPAWNSFWAVQGRADPASAAAAVRSLRDLGVITFEESAGLIDEVVGSLARTYVESDRQCVRWQRKMEAIEAANGGMEEGAEPFEYLVLQKFVERRSDGIWATCLRRVGEHELANLLIEDRAEYERLRDGALPGAWGGRGARG
jgi:hypothetical protein